ncbi:unnamed protein product, partial [Discosporangium mesarthrocarpum]
KHSDGTWVSTRRGEWQGQSRGKGSKSLSLRRSCSQERGFRGRRKGTARPSPVTAISAVGMDPVDPVARAFRAVSRRVPRATFGTPQGRRVGRNRRAVEQARLRRKNESEVGFYNICYSQTEARVRGTALFSAQVEAQEREKARIKCKHPRGTQIRTEEQQAEAKRGGHLPSQVHQAWVQEASGSGHEESKKATVPPWWRKIPSAFRYMNPVPLSETAIKLAAERDGQSKGREWLEANLHQDWSA